MSISFSYTNLDVSAQAGRQPAVRKMHLRISPYTVNWTYNMNTNIEDTYGGQVIQLLSVNIDRVTIEGIIGREGPFGIRHTTDATKDPRWGGHVPAGGWVTQDITQQFNYTTAYPGLHAMAEYFREYFAVVSQGADIQNPGRYQQIPMTITYDDAPSHDDKSWIVTPTSFPSFRRSNENFAPEWKLEAQVIEADPKIKESTQFAAITRLQDAIGYKARNPFSDPLADPTTSSSVMNDRIVSEFREILPKITEGDLADMIWQHISVPNATQGQKIDPEFLNPDNILQGEIGTNAYDQALKEHIGLFSAQPTVYANEAIDPEEE